jgi:DNA-directed RNA polymerase subunit M/transcription elongation factor TFIIS
MKCPKCGSEMHIDEHRRYALQMCYNCGYIEGRMADVKKKETNFAHLKNLNMNEAIAFISAGLDIKAKKVAQWLDDEFEK